MEAPAQTRSCVKCGRNIQWDANVCPYCGHDYRQQIPGQPMNPMMPMMPMMAPQKKQTVLPMVAGALLVIASIVWILEAVSWILVAAGINFLGDLFGLVWLVSFITGFISGIITVIAIIGLILAVVVMLGGIGALTRRWAGLALIGAIFGLFSFGPFFIGSICSLVALVLLAASHDEFK